MKENYKMKKTKKDQVQLPFPVFLANVLVLVAVLGLSYMWLCSRCDALGKEIKTLERTLATAEKRLGNEQERWSYLTSPGNLTRAIKKHGLAMSMPNDTQIVKVSYQRSANKESFVYNNK